MLILFGLALLPMVGSLGLGIEYLRKVNYQARLDTAADAAAIAAITAARDFISANPNNEADPTANAITAGLQRASAAFKANAASATTAVHAKPTVDLKRSSQELIATVSYQGSYSSSFGRLFGQPIVVLNGNVSSRLKMGTYADFYLLLDTSGSMGFPTSTDQQVSFAKQNPDMNNGQTSNNCAFACHFPETATNNHGYGIAKASGVELRIATVGNAVAQLISTAKQKATLNNQFRIGLYPFVSYIETAADLTAAIDTLMPLAGNLESYMDVGDSSTPRGSGGTHFENVLPAILNKIRANRIGDGSSSAKAQPYVFLVTDGVANSQYYNGNASLFDQSKWTGSNSNLLDPNLCAPLKNQGVKISILYIPYMPLQQPFNTNVGYENQRVNSLLPSVPGSLKSCASDGYFYTASSSAEINNALQAMFVQAISEARLTR
ncbi:phosphomannomutase [Methylobacterium sp. NPDC080182]|uniref:phosphomannomutase n=1 Tax=Methylobacterium sp. NPDC080182 TaxID=3390590 RepID=UPI003CFE4378